MNKEVVYNSQLINSKTGEAMKLKRITKSQARKVLENNTDNNTILPLIYVLPVKVRFDNMWIHPTELNNCENFDQWLNEYECYNCNSELGYYAKFYTEITD